MLIAQITDIHLGFDPDNPAEFNRKRLDQVLQRLVAMDPQPDLLLCTGDLVDRGDEASYRRLRNALEVCPFPYHLCVGNHDDRDNLRAQFPDLPGHDGFVQYVVDAGSVAIVILDTLEPGRHGGAYCERRQHWLIDTLDGLGDRPVILVFHHPPVENGVPWMNTDPQEAWVGRLEQAITGRRNIRGLIAGHVHRSFTTGFAGHVLAVSASTAPQVALELAPIDPEVPDNRAMIIADPPSYALHLWTGQGLVSHFENADDHVALARYDGKMQGLVQSLLAERPE